MRRLILLCLLPLLGACAFERVAGPSCSAFAGLDPVTVAKSSQGTEDAAARPAAPTMTPRIAAELIARQTARTEAALEETLRARVAASPRRRVVTLNVITLSAGGQYGAFGAGFMAGWSQNARTPRPVFDMVTGVSAGALLAPAVFGGSKFDGLLEQYSGLGEADLLRRRSLPALLRAPSFAAPDGLEALVARNLDPRLIDAIDAGHRGGRQLFVGTTNLDTGIGTVLDLGLAAGMPNAQACLSQALLASAAIPGLFPPRNLGGDLHADGGLRAHVFLRALDRARAEIEREAGVEVRVNAYLVVNGALRPPPRRVEDSLPSYILRSADILGDEVLRDSIAEAVDFAAARPGWRLRGIRADLPEGTCLTDAKPRVGGFDPCLTAALFEHGHDLATMNSIPWIDAAELRALAQEL